MSPSSFISINNGSIGYSNHLVATSLNLEIKKGQHWALVGASGSGKTSLLQIIAGNLQLKKGEIIRHFAQAEDGTITDFHPLIAFVASKHHFRNLSNTSDFYYQQRYNSSDSDDALTVSHYLESVGNKPAAAHHWDLDKTLSLLKLGPLADKQLIKLSNGETKRLMIAAALLKNPLLLLLDNPLAGLDTQTRADFNHIVSQIAATGITIIIATGPHEIPDAITHIGILQSGTLTAFTKETYYPAAVSANEKPLSGPELSPLLDRYPAPAYQSIVRMRNVNIRYGDKIILNSINWQISQGQRWALLGHNGAGKSTLLSLINGDNPQAYANDITLFDKKRGSGESIWDIKRKTGFISPELYQYFPADSSCLQTIESGYYDTMGLFRPSDKAKADRALHWMRVLEIDQYARQLLKNIPASAQRLCLLARAMIKCPALLILDEPSQGMDEQQIAHFKALVDTICNQTNITLIYVTHYAQHIPDSVQQVLRLSEGRISPSAP
ncbi:MAG: ATP-binding cassette domain-containing protein [Bacteroidota bacterium]